MMPLAALAAFVLTGAVLASELPEFTKNVHRVTEATVERMKNPADAYAFQLKGPDGWTQCELTEFHTISIVVVPDLHATYADAACPRHNGRADDCFCHIFVPDTGTAANYRLLQMRFAQGAPPLTDDQVQFRLQKP